MTDARLYEVRIRFEGEMQYGNDGGTAKEFANDHKVYVNAPGRRGEVITLAMDYVRRSYGPGGSRERSTGWRYSFRRIEVLYAGPCSIPFVLCAEDERAELCR